MISESVVCLDRRVVNPPAVEAGGGTTWTLPFPVAVDGSEGRVAVVRLDTETELAVTRPSPTTVRAVGSFGSAPVAIGIAYNWRYVPTVIYMKNYRGETDRRAKLQLSYVRPHLSGTRSLDATVSVAGRAPVTVTLRDSTPDEGQQLNIPVFSDSRAAVIELSSDAPWPVRIGTLGWDGQYSPQSLTGVS